MHSQYPTQPADDSANKPRKVVSAEENQRDTSTSAPSMLDRETHGQILDQPAPDADTSDLTSGLNQPASQHLSNEERVPGEENRNARSE
ncbi:hypothetical protein [Solirubrum puertoriconensis]|uniref:Uncharacterized protein n=1 Tax=Solirubrum puertoriconensis TaxID=1751427 RepID=A0A9X0L6I6_SOLP1|nr:hypothetical protein [Solirubrum puertoriconensis]KUG09833.1 hypothetical protein ASU33_19380 [Solirubrum puertoriconensis]